ncbi:39S ribosomal mitochondrial, partial [Brachionus plicatilis]
VQVLSTLRCFSSLNANKGLMDKLVVGKPELLVNYEQHREYKVKTRLRKRCKSCFFVWRNGRLYVECKEHPRHKQHHVDSLLKGYENIPHGYHIPNVK